MNYSELPIGFAMALAQNRAALETFGSMSDTQTQQLIDHAPTIRTDKGILERYAEMSKPLKQILFTNETEK